MGGTHAQAVSDIVHIIAAGEQPDEIGVLQSLDTIERGLIGEERTAVRMSHDQFIETVGDFMSAGVGKRSERSKSFEIFIGQLKKIEPPPALVLIQL